MNQRPCANGILAAVLSASFLPIHGALAKQERSGGASGSAKQGAKTPAKPPSARRDANKPSPDDRRGADDTR
jgi:hypothetical protein